MLCVHGNRVECNVNESGARDTSQIPSEHHFYYFHFLISQWSKHEGCKYEEFAWKNKPDLGDQRSLSEENTATAHKLIFLGSMSS